MSALSAEDLLREVIRDMRPLAENGGARATKWVSKLERVESVLVLYKRLVDRAFASAKPETVRDVLTTELQRIADELTADVREQRKIDGNNPLMVPEYNPAPPVDHDGRSD